VLRVEFGTIADVNPTHAPPTWIALLIPLLVLIALWDGVWKVLGMWRSARNYQIGWFVCITIFNTVGILPIIYLLWCQRDRNSEARPKPPYM